MTDDERHAQWGKWLERITEDVGDLVFRRQVFKGVASVIQANPRIQKPNSLFIWMWCNYYEAMAIGIRRQLDTDPRVVTLVKLLEDIKHHPHVLSRDRFVKTTRSMLRRGPVDEEFGQWHDEFWQKYFDEIVGPGMAHIHPHRVQDDLARVRRTAQRLERFASQRVAHATESSVVQEPTRTAVDAALDVVEELVRKYDGLVRLMAGPMIAVWSSDDRWREVLREPWIPGEVRDP